MVVLIMFPVGTLSMIEGQHLALLKAFIRKKHQSDDACYASVRNLIFLMCCHSDIPHIGKKNCGKELQILFVCIKFIRPRNVTEFQVTKVYSNLI
jgi:hypothetical protein